MSDAERVIVDALAGSRQYLAELGHSYAGKWLDANARHFIAKRALDALVDAGWHVIRIEPDEEGQAHYSGQRCRLGDEWTRGGGDGGV